jgi:hypothetical protein
MIRRLLLWLAFSFLLLDVVTARGTGAKRSTTTAVFDDFEDGDAVSSSGSAWVPLGDDLFGGGTTLRLEPIREGAHRSKGALRLAATIAGSPGSVAGAWTTLVPGGRRADLSRLDALRLSVRGPARILVGIRGGEDPGVNYMAPVEAGSEWETVTVRFADLVPQGKGHEHDTWNPTLARYVGFSSAPGAAGPMSVLIDDVVLIDALGRAGTPSFDPGEPPRTRVLALDDAAPLAGLDWRELARDGAGDGRHGLPDARALYTTRDVAGRIAWFRIDLEDPLPDNWIGVNVALDIDGDPANGMAWWGKNTAFHFDRLASAYLWCRGARCDGVVGLVSSDDAAAGRMVNDAPIHIALDRAARRVYLGLSAESLDAAPHARVLAAVGSAMSFGDDLPDTGTADLTEVTRP